jgi:hypothetical protein
VFVAEADEAMLDVCQALDPKNPALAKRGKNGRVRRSRSGLRARLES